MLTRTDSYLLKQCAAVRTQQLLRSVAPHRSLPPPWGDFSRRETCQGQPPLKEREPHDHKRQMEQKKKSTKVMALMACGVRKQTPKRLRRSAPSNLEKAAHTAAALGRCHRQAVDATQPPCMLGHTGQEHSPLPTRLTQAPEDLFSQHGAAGQHSATKALQ